MYERLLPDESQQLDMYWHRRNTQFESTKVKYVMKAFKLDKKVIWATWENWNQYSPFTFAIFRNAFPSFPVQLFAERTNPGWDKEDFTLKRLFRDFHSTWGYQLFQEYSLKVNTPQVPSGMIFPCPGIQYGIILHNVPRLPCLGPRVVVPSKRGSLANAVTVEPFDQFVKELRQAKAPESNPTLSRLPSDNG